jgi:hypothetical protein
MLEYAQDWEEMEKIVVDCSVGRFNLCWGDTITSTKTQETLVRGLLNMKG